MEGKTCSIPASTAIMFCYFNSLEYFHKYLEEYQGELLWQNNHFYQPSYLHSGPCVILIGPEEHAKRHCDPEPLYLVDSEDWRLANQLRLEGDDLIAVYVRKERK